MSESKYSETELMAFLDYTVQKGLLKENTAQSWKTAAKKVLSAIDDGEKLDLRKTDRTGVFERFVNKQGKGFSPGSLQTYRSRFNSAIDEFLKYQSGPASYKPEINVRTVRKASDEQAITNSRRPAKRNHGENGTHSHGRDEDNQHQSDEHHKQGSVTFPIPIRPGVVVQIAHLPADLTPAEASRIAAVINALAVPVETKHGGSTR